MTNRTVQIYGYGYGSTPASIEVTLDGNIVYNGTIATTSGPTPTLPDDRDTVTFVAICEFELPVDYAGTLPMSCNVTNGTVIFAEIYANYCKITNPVYTEQEIQTLGNTSTPVSELIPILSAHASPPFSAGDIAFLESNPRSTWKPLLVEHNALAMISSGPTGYKFINGPDDPRTGVTIDGISQIPDHNQYPGQWWYRVNNGSTLAYNMVVDAGME